MTSSVLVSLRVAATPQRAFEVFTGEVGLWWRPNALFQVTPRSPGLLQFEPFVGGRFTETFSDGDVFEIGRITHWEPGDRLCFSWRQASFTASETTHVEVRFELIENETRVTVEHHGWDSVPQTHVARHRFPDAIFLRRLAEWWQLQLASLNENAAA